MGRWRSSSATVALMVTVATITSARSAGAQTLPRSGTTTFVLEGNRVYALLDFVKPDGSMHAAYAYIDPGRTEMSLSGPLYDSLRAGAGGKVRFKVGDFAVDVPGDKIRRGGPVARRGTGPQLETALPAAVLEPYVVVIDYAKKTVSFGKTGSISPSGTPTPFRIDTTTGLIAVNATIDGAVYPVTIDIGSAYTWLRQETVKEWLRTHSEWERGNGAVGTANMMLRGEEPERDGILIRIPILSIGSYELRDVGAVGVSGGTGADTTMTLMDWYSKKNVVPVLGWFGGNVFKQFRLTIDYPARTMYWFREVAPDTTDLDQIGLTLRAANGAVYVAAVARKNGKPTVNGVLPGDKLISVGGHVLASGTIGQIFESMRGTPGETRELVVERDGKRFTVSAAIVAF